MLIKGVVSLIVLFTLTTFPAYTDIESTRHNFETVDVLSASKILYPIANEVGFKLENLTDYLDYISLNPNKKLRDVVLEVNLGINKPFYSDISVSKISNYYEIICNKYNKLPNDFKPLNLVVLDNKYTSYTNLELNSSAYESYKSMYSELVKIDKSIKILSAYRSIEKQTSIYNDFKQKGGLEYADKWSARPGHSEHNTGLAIDLTVSGSKFGDSKSYIWMLNNAYKYGYILSYPNNKRHITGYGYEPWHWRYVGTDLALLLKTNDLLLEEYFALYR